MLKSMYTATTVYAWRAEFEEIHTLLIFKEPCGLKEDNFPNAVFVEGIPTWQHHYRVDAAARHPGVLHWSANMMDVQ